MNFIPINGANGGGQLLRTSLTLSLITGQPFHMTNIRGARKPKPGLMRQHLTCVLAAAEISDAEVIGAELGSQELHFRPGQIKSGDYRFAIGTGGSTTLILQTLLPALLYAQASSTLRIEGGTHNPQAPPFEFINRCFMPQLHKLGVKAEVQLEKHGFMQAGGGALTANIQPLKKWKKLNLNQRGEAKGMLGTILHAHLPPDIAIREQHSAANMMEWDISAIDIQQATDSNGPGSILMLGAEYEHVTEISSAVAQLGRTAESVGSSAAKGMRGYLGSAAVAGVHLADQLLLPMALAGGGSLTTLTLTKHIKTSMELIPQFLPVKFEVTEVNGGGVSISAEKN